ncbi:PEGA domain-containing protein [bacterium]|nr:PEGA domain-containing protein [bacterium]
MAKNWLAAFITVCTIVFSSIFFVLYFNHQLSTAHFYVGVSGGNANVSMSQYNLGATPIKDINLPPGWYQFNLDTDYYHYDLPIRLSPKTATIIDWQTSTSLEKSSGVIYELTPLTTRDSLLTVVTIPDKTQLIIDESSRSASFAPLVEENLSDGHHQLQVTLPGYQTLTVPMKLTPGYELKLTVKLAQS